jgi:hypothetical protein
MLSERDRRELADIEATLSRDDPVLDRTMSGAPGCSRYLREQDKAPTSLWMWFAGFSLLMFVAGALAQEGLIILAGVTGMVVVAFWRLVLWTAVAGEDTAAGNDPS